MAETDKRTRVAELPHFGQVEVALPVGADSQQQLHSTAAALPSGIIRTTDLLEFQFALAELLLGINRKTESKRTLHINDRQVAN
jgi:hypothetical protein